MSAQHTPGRTCAACEGFCLHHADARIDAGLEMSLRIGQHVCHGSYAGKRVTGVVRGLSIDSDGTLQAHIALDAPLIIRARTADDRAISIWNQHVPAHELEPFDGRDELIAELAQALRELHRVCLGMDLERQDDRPTEEAYLAALSSAGTALAKTGSPS